jgi:hypothetical protein
MIELFLLPFCGPPIERGIKLRETQLPLLITVTLPLPLSLALHWSLTFFNSYSAYYLPIFL